MKSVIFIAPPAAGKGTQSSRLESLGYLHISTGDMLREEISKKSELGLEIENIIAKGELVSDDIVLKLVQNKLENIDKPFILDGFPRTYNQVLLLDELLNKLNLLDYEVIYLDIPLDEALKRALGRLTCSCGASFHKYIPSQMPKAPGICDKCGKELISRDDDNEESFKVRFATFLNNIEPIKEFYQDINKLHNVDATLDSDKITEEIKDILKWLVLKVIEKLN